MRPYHTLGLAMILSRPSFRKISLLGQGIHQSLPHSVGRLHCHSITTHFLSTTRVGSVCEFGS